MSYSNYGELCVVSLVLGIPQSFKVGDVVSVGLLPIDPPERLKVDGTHDLIDHIGWYSSGLRSSRFKMARCGT